MLFSFPSSELLTTGTTPLIPMFASCVKSMTSEAEAEASRGFLEDFSFLKPILMLFSFPSSELLTAGTTPLIPMFMSCVKSIFVSNHVFRGHLSVFLVAVHEITVFIDVVVSVSALVSVSSIALSTAMEVDGR